MGGGVWPAIVSPWREQTSLPLSGTRQETPPDPKAYGHRTNSGRCFWPMSDNLTTGGGIKSGTARERCGEDENLWNYYGAETDVEGGKINANGSMLNF